MTDKREAPYPDGEAICKCGRTFMMNWNGGELDEHHCECGLHYWGEHRAVVMIISDKDDRWS